jgi:hypothetical protein
MIRFGLIELFIAFTAVAMLLGSAAGMATLCRNPTGLGLLAWLISITAATLLLSRKRRNGRMASATPFVHRIIMSAVLVFTVNMIAAMLSAVAISLSAFQGADWAALSILAGMCGVAGNGVVRMTQR